MRHSEFERLDLRGVTMLLAEGTGGDLMVARVVPRRGMQVLVTPERDFLELVMVDLTPSLPTLPTSFIWDPGGEPF